MSSTAGVSSEYHVFSVAYLHLRFTKSPFLRKECYNIVMIKDLEKMPPFVYLYLTKVKGGIK